MQGYNIEGLKNKDQKASYELMLKLQQKSAESNELYPYFNEFIELISHDNSFVRNRGVTLACAQARWDIDNKLDENIDIILSLLHDKKPITVRKCLEALHEVALYKPALNETIEKAMNQMDLSMYKESMAPLIKKDMEELRKRIE